MVGNSGSEPQL